MNVWLLLLIVLIIAVLLWFWVRQRRGRLAEITAREAAGGVTPNKVMLPEQEGEPEQRLKRPPETQKLRREVVHGEYRAIEDRGAPTEVQRVRPT